MNFAPPSVKRRLRRISRVCYVRLMDRELLNKKAVAKAAVQLVQSGMQIGLGTGSTAHFFIEELIRRKQEGLSVKALASSSSTAAQAEAGGIPLLNPETTFSLDLCFDGADEIDTAGQMIKGGGGALLREKIVASMSKEMIVLIDETKRVAKLGQFPLAVEVIPFGCQATQKAIGIPSTFRKNRDGTPFLTDNGHYILDLDLKKITFQPATLDLFLHTLPGVVETGFFLNMAGRIIVGYQQGEVKIVS